MQRAALGNSKSRDQAHKHSKGGASLDTGNAKQSQGQKTWPLLVL